MKNPPVPPRKRPLVVLLHPLNPRLVRKWLAPHAKIALATTRAQRAKLLPHADAVIALLSDAVDAELIAQAPHLKVVGNHAVGVNNIDLAACKKRRIRVVNTPDVLTRSTAECALALLLAAARRIPEGEALCRANRFKGWAPDLLLGLELKGRAAVIVGAGRIGRETAKLFKAVGLHVQFITREDSPAQIKNKLRKAQILSIHVPLTPQTKHWLDAKKIALLPGDSIVINTARGPVIDEKALTSALKAKRIFAAGLDVFENEPEIPHALRKLPNVVLLPHVGSGTHTAREAMLKSVINGVLGVLSGRRPINEVKL